MDEDKEKQEGTLEEESFEELLNQSFVESKKLERGQRVKTQVLKITEDWTFLDLGRKTEGLISTRELLDKDGQLTVQEGDSLTAYYVGSEHNEPLFTMKISSGDASRSAIEEAWRSNIPVEGAVEKEIKGGFEVRLAAGNLRAFCPFSQMGLQRVDNPAVYVGQRLAFKVVEYAERGRNIIVSHRQVLEEERRERKEALKETLKEGMPIHGTITSIRSFGAFVDIGGLEGLIPISEIAWGRVEDIKEVLSVGQEVDLVILKLDWEHDRYSFSIKGATPDPWQNVEELFPQGSTHTGRVARLANFGAFVTLAEGIDGLLHISRLGAGRKIKHPKEVVSPGQEIEVKIDSIDKAGKRLSLSLAGQEQAESSQQTEEEDYRQFVSKKPGTMGTFGDMLRREDKRNR